MSPDGLNEIIEAGNYLSVPSLLVPFISELTRPLDSGIPSVSARVGIDFR